MTVVGLLRVVVPPLGTRAHVAQWMRYDDFQTLCGRRLVSKSREATEGDLLCRRCEAAFDGLVRRTEFDLERLRQLADPIRHAA